MEAIAVERQTDRQTDRQVDEGIHRYTERYRHTFRHCKPCSNLQIGKSGPLFTKLFMFRIKIRLKFQSE